jgi:uncharacterized membrane protein (GlpM family)
MRVLIVAFVLSDEGHVQRLTSLIRADEHGMAALLHPRRRECTSMTNFVVYLIGTLLVVGGLAYGASRLGISEVWIIAGALVIIGIGVMGGIVKTRQKEPS